MTFNKKTALYDNDGNRISDYYEDIHISKEDNRFAIVERTSQLGVAGINKEYTFIKPDGTLLCNEWFVEVARFGKKDNGVKVKIWDPKKGHCKNAILLDTGKIIARNRYYKIESNMVNGVAIVAKNGRRNVINDRGNLISKKWFREVKNLNIDDTFIWIMDEKDRSNFMTRDGKMFFEDFVNYFKSWDEKYYVAICIETRMFIVASKENKSIVCTVKMDKNCTLKTFYNTKLLYVKNDKNKCNLISHETGKPLFTGWSNEIKEIELEDTCCFTVKNSDGTWSLYDSEGKKLTKQKYTFVVPFVYKDNRVKAVYYTKKNRRMKHIINVMTGEKEKYTED